LPASKQAVGLVSVFVNKIFDPVVQAFDEVVDPSERLMSRQSTIADRDE
jgi:hypothetical protein